MPLVRISLMQGKPPKARLYIGGTGFQPVLSQAKVCRYISS
jgi:hypothetical protein